MTTTELLSNVTIALNVIGVIVTLATFYYAREAASKFGESTVGDASRDISYGTVFLIGFMVLNAANQIGLEILQNYQTELGLATNGALVAGIFFYAIAFNRLAEVIQ